MVLCAGSKEIRVFKWSSVALLYRTARFQEFRVESRYHQAINMTRVYSPALPCDKCTLLKAMEVRFLVH